MTAQTVIALLITSAICLHAEPRLWKGPNGQRSISGEFIKRDATTVTIRYADGKTITSPLANLHPYDLNWLEMMHPFPDPATPDKSAPDKTKPDRTTPDKTKPDKTKPDKPAPDKALLDKAALDKAVTNKAAVFDQLVFGESRDKVLAKLKASKFVEMTLDETYIGRTGLNGIFRTRKKIGGLDASLFFEWTDGGTLKELTLQTETLPAASYKTRIEPSWKEFVNLLTTLYDKPVQQGSLPRPESLTDGAFSPSHLWALDAGGSVLLGTARDGEQFQLVVRFTQKQIKPVALP